MTIETYPGGTLFFVSEQGAPLATDCTKLKTMLIR